MHYGNYIVLSFSSVIWKSVLSISFLIFFCSEVTVVALKKNTCFWYLNWGIKRIKFNLKVKNKNHILRQFWQCYLKVKWTRNRECLDILIHFLQQNGIYIFIYYANQTETMHTFLTIQYSIYSLITFKYKSALFEIQ